MRRKLPATEKRNNLIGIKVKTETREQLNYIANLEGHTLSTYIDALLREHIRHYFKAHKINWEKLPPEERRGEVREID